MQQEKGNKAGENAEPSQAVRTAKAENRMTPLLPEEAARGVALTSTGRKTAETVARCSPQEIRGEITAQG